MTNQDELIHQEILQAALRLYRKSGPPKVTLDNVAKATGRSRSSLYYYFENRDEIFQAVLDQIAEEAAAEIRDAVAAAGSPQDKVYAFCLTKIKTTEEWKRVFGAMDLVMSAGEKSKHSKLMDALHKKLMYMERGILSEALANSGQSASRQLSNAELDMLAFIISSGIRGIRREIYDHNDPHEVKLAARLFADLIAGWLHH